MGRLGFGGREKPPIPTEDPEKNEETPKERVDRRTDEIEKLMNQPLPQKRGASPEAPAAVAERPELDPDKQEEVDRLGEINKQLLARLNTLKINMEKAVGVAGTVSVDRDNMVTLKASILKNNEKIEGLGGTPEVSEEDLDKLIQ